MVLQALINPLKAEKTPAKVLLLGMLYATIAIFLSLWVFRQQSSLVMVFFTVMASLPLVYSTFKLEESKDITIDKELVLLREHSKALMLLVFLFLGFVGAFSFWYIFFPTYLTNILFQTQSETISLINNNIAGNAVNSSLLFTKIFSNNLRVLMFSFFFSLLYGTGVIFILAWNASVIGTATGKFIESFLSQQMIEYGTLTTSSYLAAVSLSVLRYFIHGIPEMASYFIAGLAGAMISIALVRKHFMSIKFERIIFDTTGLLVISVLILTVAAFLEVYVTPLFFG